VTARAADVAAKRGRVTEMRRARGSAAGMTKVANGVDMGSFFLVEVPPTRFLCSTVPRYGVPVCLYE
jgi:hypothetical protein